MDSSLLSFFTDPILRAPTIGCMLMCIGASLMGVIVFLRKQSLVGEALSHAAYPGVIGGVLIAGMLSIKESQEGLLSLCILIGAFLTSLAGLWMIQWLEKQFRVPSDAALCLVLSTFFGVGLTIASEVQFSYTSLYKQVLTYLYGQAATMTDVHIVIYGGLSFLIIAVIFLFYKEIQIITFDHAYAKSLGISVHWINSLLFVLVTLAVIIGIRSVGVVLMSAMLIAPPAAARQFTNRLSVLFLLSAFFGMVSGFFGNYLSIRMSDWLTIHDPSLHLILPTGPMIVLVASTICLLSLLFAPERGLLVRLCRASLFRYRCLVDNILKTVWRLNKEKSISFSEIMYYQSIPSLYLKFLLWRMERNGWMIKRSSNQFSLTEDGKHRAAKIVRLHRLWEVYLVNDLGLGAEHVHCSAEEMEHIITPAIEMQLTELLHDPKEDPHHQPIPTKESLDAF
jgi:manganese/zinc/iron transport system permease protein